MKKKQIPSGTPKSEKHLEFADEDIGDADQLGDEKHSAPAEGIPDIVMLSDDGTESTPQQSSVTN